MFSNLLWLNEEKITGGQGRCVNASSVHWGWSLCDYKWDSTDWSKRWRDRYTWFPIQLRFLIKQQLKSSDKVTREGNFAKIIHAGALVEAQHGDMQMRCILWLDFVDKRICLHNCSPRLGMFQINQFELPIGIVTQLFPRNKMFGFYFFTFFREFSTKNFRGQTFRGQHGWWLCYSINRR